MQVPVELIPRWTQSNKQSKNALLRTCSAKIFQLGPLYTRTLLALNLKQVLVYNLEKNSVLLGK